jgi:hypothetical protein
VPRKQQKKSSRSCVSTTTTRGETPSLGDERRYKLGEKVLAPVEKRMPK